MLCLLSELGCVKFEVCGYGQDFGFLVEVCNVCVHGAACDISECIVLHCLQFVDVGGGCDGRPDCVRAFYYWAGDCLVGDA